MAVVRRNAVGVGVADRADVDIVDARPGPDQRIQRLAVGCRQLRRQHVEVQRQHVVGVLGRGRLAQHARLAHRRALVLRLRRIEVGDRLGHELTGVFRIDGRTEGHLVAPLAAARVQHEHDRVAGRARTWQQLAVDARTARDQRSGFGQQHGRAEIAQRDVAIATQHQLVVDAVWCTAAGVDQLERHGAAVGRLAPQIEVGALHQPRLQVDPLRVRLAAKPRRGIALGELQPGRQRQRVDLRHVSARGQPFHVEAPAGIGDRVAPVFEVYADALDPGLLAKRVVAAVRLEHAADQRAAAAEQVFAQPNPHRRLVRCDTEIGHGIGGVQRLPAARPAGDLHDVGQRQRRGGREITERKLEARTGIAGKQRIGDHGVVEARRARNETKARRWRVAQHDARRRHALRRVLQHQLVTHVVADRGGRRARALGQEQSAVERIQRYVADGGCAGDRLREDIAERRLGEIERRAGQRVEVGDRAVRRRDVLRGWHDLQAVTAGRHRRETEAAGRHRVDDARCIGRRRAADHRRRITADAVIAEDARRLAGAVVDQRDRGAVHRQPGRRVEHDRQRLDHRAISTRGPA